MIFLRLLQVLLLVLAAASTADAVKVAVCEYSEVLDVNNDGLTLQHYVNNLDNTITMKLTFEGWQSWLGIGVSETGMMSDAVAVIGRISPDDGTPNVQEYNMINNNKDGSGVIPFEEGASTLVSSTFSQTEASSTLEFTKPFDEITTFIYAVGLKKNQWEGKHKLHGSLTLEEVNFCEEIDVGDEDDDGEDDGGRDDDLCELAPPIQIDSNLFLEQIRHEETFTMRLTYTGGKSWIGIGLKEEGKVSDKPPAAVIGRVGPDGKSRVDKYMFSSPSDVLFMAQQNLMDATFEQTGTTSVLTFTKYLSEPYDVPEQIVTYRTVWMYAVGLPDNAWGGVHKIHGSILFDFSTCDDSEWSLRDSIVGPDVPKEMDAMSRSFWMAHGILLLLSWVVLCPLGICICLLRKILPNSWYKVHIHCHNATLFFTAIAILLGVLANKRGGRPNIQTDHSYFGLAVFGLIVIQTVVSFFDSHLNQSGSSLIPARFHNIVRLRVTRQGIEAIDLENASKSVQAKEMGVEKSPKLRVMAHRFIGIFVLGLALYTCYTGVKSDNEVWTEVWTEDYYYYIAIGVLVGICFITLLFKAVGSMSSDNVEDIKIPATPPRRKTTSSSTPAPTPSPESTSKSASTPKSVDPPGKSNAIYHTIVKKRSREDAP